MNRSIIPWKRNKVSVTPRSSDPFSQLQMQMNELFDNFFSDSPFALARDFMNSDDKWFRAPQVDVSETDKEISLTADLPGVDEKDIKVTLDRDILTIEAEKNEEKDEKDKQYHLSERRFGKFTRSFRLPESGVKEDDIKASFKNGVLKLTLPKTEPAESTSSKQIAITAE